MKGTVRIHLLEREVLCARSAGPHDVAIAVKAKADLLVLVRDAAAKHGRWELCAPCQEAVLRRNR